MKIALSLFQEEAGYIEKRIPHKTSPQLEGGLGRSTLTLQRATMPSSVSGAEQARAGFPPVEYGVRKGSLKSRPAHSEIQSVSRKKVPKARGPSPAGIFAVTASVSALMTHTSFENQLTT